MTDDARLLRSYAQDGSEASFRELVERHIGVVYSAALQRVGQRGHLAEEVTQEVFCALARKGSVLAGHSSLLGWLYTATRYVSADLTRAERRRQHWETEAHPMIHPTPGRDVEPDWATLRPHLQDALDHLKPRDREAVLLRFFEKRRFAEIAAALQLSEAAAQKRVDRALDQLRLRLVRRGLTSSSSALAAFLTEQSFAAPAGLGLRIASTAAAQWSAAGLAGASGAAATLMTASKVAWTVSLAAALLAGGVGVYHWSSAVRIERQSAAASDDAVRLAASLRALQSHPVAAPGIAVSPPPPPRASLLLDEGVVARAHPDLTKRLLKLKVRGAFVELYARLNLTPAQIDQIESLVVDAMFREDYSDPPLTDAERAAVRDQMTADAIGIVGAQDFQAFDDFDAFHNYREIVERVARQVYTTDSPLTAAQGAALQQLLIDHAATSGRSDSHPGPVDTIDWDSVLAQAPAKFDAGQVEALRRIALNAQFSRQFQELVASQQP